MPNNIIVYFTDQQRWDTCGCFGQPLDITPNLDYLAREGVKFDTAFSPQPVCGPCRALFQTGKYPTDLKHLPHCTAVVCCNYMIYQLVRQVLEKQGKRVPEDCSLVCFDYSNEDWEEGVTCSVYQGYRIGQEVASRLMRMIRNRDCDDINYTYVLAPEIYLGRSVGPAKK